MAQPAVRRAIGNEEPEEVERDAVPRGWGGLLQYSLPFTRESHELPTMSVNAVEFELEKVGAGTPPFGPEDALSDPDTDAAVQLV